MDNRKYILAVGAAIWLLLFFVLAMPMIVENLQITNRQETFDTVTAICDYSRTINDGEAETACAIAQNVTGTEYMCEYMTDDIKCYTERK